MNLLLRTAFAAVLVLVLGAAPAHADPNHHFTGRCEVEVVGDGATPQTWTGVARVAVTATDTNGVPAPAVPITVDCELHVNGVHHSTVVSASGLGSASNSAPTVYQAGPTDIVTLCQDVTVGGEPHYNCNGVVTTHTGPMPPAYGGISITDLGTGPTTDTTYDPATWTCQTTAGTTGVEVTCTPTAGLVFGCPLMVVTTSAGPNGVAGGRAACQAGGPTVDTGVVVGPDAKSADGNLGTVTSITCTAYAPLAPPYQVVCYEPGAPEL